MVQLHRFCVIREHKEEEEIVVMETELMNWGFSPDAENRRNYISTDPADFRVCSF